MRNLLHITDDLGQRIRSARNGMPQTMAAKELGVSLRTWQAWEAGRAFPQWRHRERLSNWLEDREEENAA